MNKKLSIAVIIIFVFVFFSIKNLTASKLSSNSNSAAGGVWLKGDMHMHTNFSDGAPNTVEDRVRQARKNCLDFIIITDHITAKTNKESLIAQYDEILEVNKSNPDIIVLWGFEWTYRWHILGYGLAPDNMKFISENVQEEITAISNSGGVAFFAHPDWSEASYNDLYYLENLRGFEGFNYGHMESFIMVGKEWDALLMTGKNYIIIGGSDAHGSEEAGQWGVTFIYCPNATEKGIIEGLKRGCIYFSESDLVGASWKPIFRLEFTINGTSMGQTLIPSQEKDEVTADLWINISIVEGQSVIHTISIVSNGEVIKNFLNVNSFNFSSYIKVTHAKVPSYFRIIANNTDGKYVVSNPIFIGRFTSKIKNSTETMFQHALSISFSAILIILAIIIAKHLMNLKKFQRSLVNP
jgi:hypothetical protein